VSRRWEGEYDCEADTANLILRGTIEVRGAMDNCFENNWVERRFAREEKLNDIGKVWLDVCTAISAAIRSFNKHYRAGSAQIDVAAMADNGTFRVIVPDEAGSVSVQIDINRNGRKIFAQYSSGISNRSFTVDANHETTYLKHGDDRCDADDVSRLILGPILFPSKTQAGFRGERIL
jgi:hypothetical protein